MRVWLSSVPGLRLCLCSARAILGKKPRYLRHYAVFLSKRRMRIHNRLDSASRNLFCAAAPRPHTDEAFPSHADGGERLTLSSGPPTMAADFDRRSYWHERFASETTFDWLQPSHEFMSVLQPHLDRLDPSSARILHLGSGTSDLHNHLRRRGFLDVTNLDYEPLAAQRGRQLERAAFGGDVRMRYLVADATQLGPVSRRLGRHAEFDLVIDKSTVDAVSCGGESPLLRMARGVCAHLAPGAAWVSLSYSASRFDVERLPFDVEIVAKLPTPKRKATDPDIYHWCYCLRPKQKLNRVASKAR